MLHILLCGEIYNVGESCMPPTYGLLATLYVAEFCTQTLVHRYMRPLCLFGQTRVTSQHQAETCTLMLARPRFIQLSVLDAGRVAGRDLDQVVICTTQIRKFSLASTPKARYLYDLKCLCFFVIFILF